MKRGIKKIVRWYLKNEWWRPLVNEKNSLPMEAGVVIEKFKLRPYKDICGGKNANHC
ncbi:hypothetical protein [Pyrococcus kukulkanii]|uniref:Uncharacterized protein n=1 Tax=Pyrococcus kukulkanii TaxID=1609559 RepID=A0ABV4T812_9EURY